MTEGEEDAVRSVAFVVPFRERGRRSLETLTEHVLPAILRELGPRDSLVVSDQGSPQEALQRLSEWAAGLPLSVVVDSSPPPVWAISRARNVGLRASEALDYVWCVDADVEMPPGAVRLAKLRIEERPGVGLAPTVADVGSPDRVRVGSGVAALPQAPVRACRGWDETFQGYGSEDIDLFCRIARLDGWQDWRCLHWADGPTFGHHAHPPQDRKLLYGRVNLECLRARAGQPFYDVEVNPGGWGEGGLYLVRHGVPQ